MNEGLSQKRQLDLLYEARAEIEDELDLCHGSNEQYYNLLIDELEEIQEQIYNLERCIKEINDTIRNV